MVDPGDTVSATLKKEFGEEAMNSLEASPEEKKKIEEQVHQLFSHGKEVCAPLLITNNLMTMTIAVTFQVVHNI